MLIPGAAIFYLVSKTNLCVVYSLTLCRSRPLYKDSNVYILHVYNVYNVILLGETNKGVGKAGQGRGRSKARVQI